MIGRGTRILEKDTSMLKSWCTHKDRFLIMDHWNNFKYFGEKPEGEPPPVQDATPVKVFRIRLLKLRIFQASGEMQRFEKIKAEIIGNIKTLPENSITVKEHRREIDKVLSEIFWESVDYDKCEYLKETFYEIMKNKLPDEAEIVKLELDDLVYDDLFEPPFTQFGTDAAIRLFQKEELSEIIGILNGIKV
ncbi:hypothetical protein AUJ66_02870 [Candidatus Desantisbacteria bacterium CG1_02_38_46]|uniref:EcoEI R protein C-terminal domain-containing protein n=1 Tax=Candidatus Desantisbacteria bacterium CG1_02_38_46 TaxID=1817893 RepID=A0A1J4SDM5_9BACT|nr:MAG: hypothetical protein AUJ66_02870 [Candidatus Desantisbacteria bacterium CG1_02_38_46]